MDFGFAGASYTSWSQNADAQRTVNLYPEIIESRMGKTRIALYATPGTVLFEEYGNGPIRGMLYLNDHLFAVSGHEVFDILSDATATLLGSIDDDGLPAWMAANPDELFIVSNGRGYIVRDGALRRITATGFPAGAVGAAFIDGYFLTTGSDNYFYISALNDGFRWDALDRGRVESSANARVSLLGDHRELWVFGNQITQPFTNTGAPDFPFEPIRGAAITQGLGAAASAAPLDNSIYWLGLDLNGQAVVWRANGYTPVRVSDHAVENAMQSYSAVSDAIAWTYQQNGHSFYVLFFPTANRTWAYDIATEQWCERSWYNEQEGTEEAHRGRCHAFAFGSRHLVGDRETGEIWELRLDAYDDDGEPIRRTRRAPFVSTGASHKRVFHKSLTVDFESGVGTSLSQGVNPQLMLRFSNDGAKTWSDPIWTGAGRMGDTLRRAKFTRLGSARTRCYEITMTDPVKWAILGADLDAVPGFS